MHSLLSSVREFFSSLRTEPGLVAVSGGADSVALARLLWQLHQEGLFPRLVLGHLNHHLRGSEGDADEAFVQTLAKQWHLPCRTDRRDVRELGKNLEAAARKIRYQWFTEIARTEGLRWIAAGHTADDQAETVLHRLLRGAGLQGLRGILPRRSLAPGIELVRPLLTVRRRDLLGVLEEENIPFRVDSSNFDRRLTRNRIRHDLLPHLEQNYSPALVPLLGRLANQAREAFAVLEERTQELLRQVLLPRAGRIVVLDVRPLAAVGRHLVCEVLRRLWEIQGGPRDRMNQEAWIRLADFVLGGEGTRDLPGKIHVRRVGPVVQFHFPSNWEP